MSAPPLATVPDLYMGCAVILSTGSDFPSILLPKTERFKFNLEKKTKLLDGGTSFRCVGNLSLISGVVL